jgi:hypothetical protein
MKKEVAMWQPLFFFGFFTVKFFFVSRSKKKEPAIDIAGLCLPLKPQKEKIQNIFH